jgi:hypothetical protein
MHRFFERLLASDRRGFARMLTRGTAEKLVAILSNEDDIMVDLSRRLALFDFAECICAL